MTNYEYYYIIFVIIFILSFRGKKMTKKNSKGVKSVNNEETLAASSADVSVEKENENNSQPIEETKNKKIKENKDKDADKKKKDDKKAKKSKLQDEDDNKEPSLKDLFGGLFKKKQKNEPVVQKRVKRVKTDYQIGLTAEQVNERIEKGYTNKSPNKNVKTIRSIIFENVFTFFNILCFLVAAALIVVDIYYKQSWSNILFIVIIIINIIIGIVQELRAKSTIEKLSLLSAPVVKVIRDRVEESIALEDVVIDDIVTLSTGKQIVADCVIVEGNVEVNESVLTGESAPIKKKVGDTLLAGSYVISGHCHARVEKIGANNYIQQLAISAKKYRKPKSELFNSLKLIVKVIGILIVPITVLMYINNATQPGSDIVSVITTTAGSIIGMIPAGMFLLCSVSLTVSVIKLANKKALVQDLYCVEMLARVNVLCLDKTGTITDGTMKVFNCVQLTTSEHTIKRIMGSMLSALGDNNQTSQALINYFGFNKELSPIATIPFSSSRKLSAVTFDGAGTYIMGAPEFVMPKMKNEKLLNMVEQYSKDGYRMLLLAHSTKPIEKDSLPEQREAIAIIILEDHIRENAVKTISWFKNNGVKVKIISGDNPLTVSEIARRVGVEGTDAFISLDGLNEKQVMAAANKYTVFGRVTPEQKALLIKSIKSDGNTVAMTGDGVNDAPALKTASVGVAMGGMGSDIAIDSADIALTTDDILKLPYLKRLSVATRNTIKTAITISMCINFAAMTLSVLGVLNPTTGALVHNAGSCFVVLIAALLYDRKFE